MTLAILEPFSGIAGDMALGALVHVGLPEAFVRALPSALGLNGVGVSVRDVMRSQVACKKVDFHIPDQTHGRHLDEIRDLVERAPVPAAVRGRAHAVFTALATVEAAIHGVDVSEVHLHEVGAVDAILDVVGVTWGLAELGIDGVHCGAIALGDGFVRAAHGVLPVPAPATLRLLEGQVVRPGPEGCGELVTPTGAALVRVLSVGPPPSAFVPLRSGYGAGTKDLLERPNALRVTLAAAAGAAGGTHERAVLLAADLDDMTPEHMAWAAEALRAAGALDVVLTATVMKKGRPGTRLEALVREADAAHLEALVFRHTTTLGVRRIVVERLVLPRHERRVAVLGHEVRVKVAVLPSGATRGKPEHEDVRAVAEATGRTLAEVLALVRDATERAG